MADETPKKLQQISDELRTLRQQDERHHNETIRDMRDRAVKISDLPADTVDTMTDILDVGKEDLAYQKNRDEDLARKQRKKDEQEREWRRSFLGVLSGLGKDFKLAIDNSKGGFA